MYTWIYLYCQTNIWDAFFTSCNIWHSDEPLEEFEQTATLDELPELFPPFFVPPLEEKPQNSILDILKLSATNQTLPPRPLLPTERAGLASGQVELLLEVQPPTPVHMLWNELLTRKTLPKNQILSWDKLRPSHRSSITTPFLSEQDSWVFAAAPHRWKDSSRHKNSESFKYMSRTRKWNLGSISPFE
ncbi:hypothetical protein BDQ17DRAFT_1327206 [Cyathus striatus]|nr:hypothetical protein BDQ17DRAFT_1327206 [Cyathus striatus]